MPEATQIYTYQGHINMCMHFNVKSKENNSYLNDHKIGWETFAMC